MLKKNSPVLLYKTLSLATETVFCGPLLQRMTGMEIEWNRVEKVRPTVSSFNAMPTKLNQNLLWLVVISKLTIGILS